jgi:hypothetical protein
MVIEFFIGQVVQDFAWNRKNCAASAKERERAK